MDTEHIHIDKRSPAAYRALIGVATAVGSLAAESGLPRPLVELVNVRVSQLNGCPSCLEIHTRKAVAAGVTDKQRATLPAWRDSRVFDEREQAALRLAEITTTLPDHDTAERETPGPARHSAATNSRRSSGWPPR
jgi:AhpD family alkylhydroperoxidase